MFILGRLLCQNARFDRIRIRHRSAYQKPPRKTRGNRNTPAETTPLIRDFPSTLPFIMRRQIQATDTYNTRPVHAIQGAILRSLISRPHDAQRPIPVMISRVQTEGLSVWQPTKRSAGTWHRFSPAKSPIRRYIPYTASLIPSSANGNRAQSCRTDNHGNSTRLAGTGQRKSLNHGQAPSTEVWEERESGREDTLREMRCTMYEDRLEMLATETEKHSGERQRPGPPTAAQELVHMAATVSSVESRLSWMSGSIGRPLKYLVNWPSIRPAAMFAV